MYVPAISQVTIEIEDFRIYAWNENETNKFSLNETFEMKARIFSHCGGNLIDSECGKLTN